jgi:hypothetical protein
MAGAEYEITLWQNMEPKRAQYTFNDNLRALEACLGWTPDKTKQYQSTTEGAAVLIQLMTAMLCYDINTLQPTNAACCFAGQVVVQITHKINRKPQKDANGQPLFDAFGQQAVKDYDKTVWEGKIPLTDLGTLGLDNNAIIRAFGSAEAYNAAVAQEQKFLAM